MNTSTRKQPPSGEYKHACMNLETKWRQYWDKHQTYAATIQTDQPKYYVLDMFPYPSGEGLHVGHPVGYIASDIIARYKMLTGYNVLHPMGFDAFGLPAEQYAIQTGAHPQATTQANMAKYEQQLRQMGLAYDWSRKIATCDSSYYHWTQWVFLALYNHYYHTKRQQARPIAELTDHLKTHGTDELHAATHDHHDLTAHEFNQLNTHQREHVLQRYRLAYLDDALVNWCDELATVLANDEIKDGLSIRGGHPVRQTKLKHWKLRVSAYAPRLLAGLDNLKWSDALKRIQRHWLGRSSGMQVTFAISAAQVQLKIFTSRVETIYGVSFLVMAPEHPLATELTTASQLEDVTTYLHQVSSQSLKERAAGTNIPTGVFTGSYGLHPLTGRQLPIWISTYVLMDYGEGAIMAVPADDERDRLFAEQFQLPILRHYQAHTPLDGLTPTQARTRAQELLLERQAGQPQINFRLRDAIFARQRYWGEPIPIYYDGKTPYPLDPAHLPLKLPPMDEFTPADTGQPPLASVKDWTYQGHPLDVTTMPGYAGSSAYYLRYMDPHNPSALVGAAAAAYWQNVDLYVGGAEHATGHLIYARTWNMFLYDIGISQTEEPFKQLLNQGMMLGESQYIYRIKGSNTFVSYGRHSHHQTQRIPISITLVDGGRLNLNTFRTWRPEFADSTFICDDDGHFRCESVIEKMSKSLFNTVAPDAIIKQYGADTLRLYEMFLGPIDQAKPWSPAKITGVYRFLGRFWRLFHRHGEFAVSTEPPTHQELQILHKTIHEVRSNTTSFHFNVAIASLMRATSDLGRLQCTKAKILHPLVLLIAPYCPHLAEELHEKLGHEPSLFTHACLPEADPVYLSDPTYELPVSVNGKVKFKVMMKQEATEAHIKAEVSAHPLFQTVTTTSTIVKWIIRPQAIVNLVTRAKEPPQTS